MKYFIVIEYVCCAENIINDTIFEPDSFAIYNNILSNLAKKLSSFACLVSEADRLDARIGYILERQFD